MTKKIVLLKQAAKITGLSEHELYNGARGGKYPSFRLGGKRGRWAFDIELLEKRIKELMLQNVKEETPGVAEYGHIRRIDVGR